MAVYAYLRVSTDRQDVANQRYGLFEYANQYGLVQNHETYCVMGSSSSQ